MSGSVFKALGHPARRELLDALFQQDGQTLGELEARFEMTRFGVMKHLRVLEDAGLVVTRKVGREKHHYLNPVPLKEIHDRWIGKFAGAAGALLELRSRVEKGAPMDEKPSHVFVVFIKATPERVWEAITTSEYTLQYYYSSTVESEWTQGSDYVYSIQGNPAIVGQVLEADPPRRLVCSFDARWDERVAPDPPSRITWEIEGSDDGLSKLTVVHDGFGAETATFQQVVGGMPYILSGLKTLLETGEPLVRAPAPERIHA